MIQTTDDVLPILYLPCATPEFEAGIWGAVIDNKRDWTDTEKEYLRRNQGIRESIIDWCAFMNNGNATDANLEFLREWDNAEVLSRPSVDHNPTTRKEPNR